ncbi:MAG: efflux RND transporter periplasmic adaptor subunit [Porphyromonas sp.]|nr:efflux RND transporter periplasmic adaptor subunit [Porphyromonas sp.]
MSDLKKKKKKRSKTFVWIIGAVFVIGLVGILLNKTKPTGTEYQLVTPTSNDTIRWTTVLTGAIEPRDEVMVKPQMNGIVAELLHQPGDYVEVGELLARIQLVPDVAMIQNASARVEAARVKLNQLKEVYNRDKQLFEEDILAREQYEQSYSAYKSAEIDLNSAIEALELATKGSSARTANQNNTLVRATVSGTILEQPVKVGTNVIQANNFSEGTTVVSIADLTDLLFVGDVNESDVNSVETGVEVTIRIGALPDRSFPAVVEYISPKGVDKSGTILYEIKAALTSNDLEGIRAGFSSNAEVELNRVEGVMSVPESCITYDAGRAYVHVSTNGGNSEKDFEPREVVLGLSDGLTVEVKSGLNGDEQLRGNRLGL